MEVDLYKAKKTPEPKEVRTFVFVQKGTDIKSLSNEVTDRCGKLFYQKTLKLEPDENRIALDTNEAIDNIDKYGYYIKDTRITMQITTNAA